jgi:hypothetical protein
VGYATPFVPTELIPGGTYFEISARRACLRFSYYRDGDVFRSGLVFEGVRALRCRASGECTIWQKDPYGFLVEVSDSVWVAELASMTHPPDNREMHHYMIYLDDTKCYEIVANSWGVLSELPGNWSPSELSPFILEPDHSRPLDEEELEFVRTWNEAAESHGDGEGDG